MMNYNFAVLIVSHGRPNRVKTATTLRRQGYTGKIYIILDDEDKTRAEYESLYENVIVFNKQEAILRGDKGDNFAENRSVLFARNSCFEIARILRLDYFLELDDDYSSFYFRFTSKLNRAQRLCHNLDKVFNSMVKCLVTTNATTIAFGQGGDVIGGYGNDFLKSVRIKRKAMNTFFCAVDKPFEFLGQMNDDVNMYVTLGNRGALIYTVFLVTINQDATQKNAGGLTDIYLTLGTYVKSFYTVMYNPSCVKVYSFGVTNKRLHHRVEWGNAVPQIIGEQHVKRLQH